MLPNPPLPTALHGSGAGGWGSSQEAPARLRPGEAAGELGTANTAEYRAERWERDVLTRAYLESIISSLCGHGGGYEQHCGFWIV